LQEVSLADPPKEVETDYNSVNPVESPWDFQVVLERESPEDKFGMTYIMDRDSQHLVVQTVKPTGVCARHNWEMRQFPGAGLLHQRQVVPRDEITVVNGRTKPGEWCGVSEQRCSSCSGGHARYCPTGCAAGVLQKDAVPAQATWANHSVTKAACLAVSAGVLLLATMAGAAIRWSRLSRGLPSPSPDDDQRAVLCCLSDERHAQAP